jgi:malonyl-CoA decarboxylase
MKSFLFFNYYKNKSLDSPAYIKRMNDNLRDLLATWFTTGLLEVERVTWQSPCEIGETLNKYFYYK